jgi:hypothetical protein
VLTDQTRKMFKAAVVGLFGIVRKAAGRQFPAAQMILKALATVAFA